MINRKLLNDFKEMKIFKKDLCDILGMNLVSLSIDVPVIIDAIDVINVLNAYKDGNFSKSSLLDWVNTVWFTELFSYNDEHCDSIANVMNKLEELDESGETLSNIDIDRYIQALRENKEI